MKRLLSMRIEADHLDALEARATFYGLTLSELLRRAIESGLPAVLEQLAAADAARRGD